MRKPAYAIDEQQRRRSACASEQSDQRLCCSLPVGYFEPDPQLKHEGKIIKNYRVFFFIIVVLVLFCLGEFFLLVLFCFLLLLFFVVVFFCVCVCLLLFCCFFSEKCTKLLFCSIFSITLQRDILRNFKNATFYVDCFLYRVDLMLFPIQYFILSCDKQQLTIKRILLKPFILTLP